MKKIILAIIIMALWQSPQAQTRNYFKYLKDFGNGAFLPEKSEIPKNINTENITGASDDIPIALVTIAPKDKDKILLIRTYGPSDDPAFIFCKKINGEYQDIFTINADEIYIPGNGYIYTHTRSNQTFIKRQKFKYSKNQIKEIPQPYYYVGLKTKTLKNIKIYSDYQCENKLAVIAKNSEIEVVAAEFNEENKKFLIKTPFGLMGWWPLDKDYPESEEIEGISFAGD